MPFAGWELSMPEMCGLVYRSRELITNVAALTLE